MAYHLNQLSIQQDLHAQIALYSTPRGAGKGGTGKGCMEQHNLDERFLKSRYISYYLDGTIVTLYNPNYLIQYFSFILLANRLQII